MTFVPNQEGIEQLGRDAVRQSLPHYQQQYDELLQNYAGKPVDEVKAALVAMYRGNGGRITDPALTQQAEKISEGTRIIVTGP